MPAIAGPWALNWGLMVTISCLIGAGLGIAYSAMPSLIMRAVRVEQTGEANGVNALMRVVGTSMSAAVVGMILTWSMIAATAPDGQTIAVPSEVGYLWSAGISLGACVVASVVALTIPASRRVVEERV